GSKYIPSKIYIQKDSMYVEKIIRNIAKDSIKEDVTAVIANFNNDEGNDLITGSGGGDFYNKMAALTDNYYIKAGTNFETGLLPENFYNTAIIRENDFDDDGDLDLFIGNNAITNDFGNIPDSYLLRNENGKFIIEDNKEFSKLGMITDAVWSDFDGDGMVDLI